MSAILRVARNWVLALPLIFAAEALPTRAETALPERVTFMSADNATSLIGYVFKPQIMQAERAPAIVMMHGRAGAYSQNAKTYEAATLSLRHKAWGRIWAEAGYVAILVDGFGPRSHPQGFARFSYTSRPAELSEVAVRPLDAYGALAYLRTRPDVMPDRVGLQGWSNGGSAALVTISDNSPGIKNPTAASGFRAALVFYPGCGLKGHFEARPFKPYAPTLVFHGTADEEVSYQRCQALIASSRQQGGDAQIVIYKGATHSFDSPGKKRQAVPANAEANQDAIAQSRQFFATHLKR